MSGAEPVYTKWDLPYISSSSSGAQGWRALVGMGCCWELWKGRTSPALGLSRCLVRPATLHRSWILNNCTAPGLLGMAAWTCWTTFMSSFVNSRRWGRKLSGLRSVISAITCSDSSLNRYFMHFYYIIFWSTAIKSMTFIVHYTTKCVSYWFLCVYLRILFILCYLFNENEDTENPMCCFTAVKNTPHLYILNPHREWHPTSQYFSLTS